MTEDAISPVEAEAAPRPVDGRPRIWLSLALVLAVLAVFGRSISFAFVELDDHFYIDHNEAVRAGLSWDGVAWAFTTTYASLWVPLTWISHMADVSVWGLAPAGHHFTSVAFHAANAALAFLAIERMTGARWRSFVVAALFALHPMRAESVAWVAERKDVLSMFFALLTLWAYAAYARDAPRRLTRYAPVFAAFGLALLAKSSVVTLPIGLLLLDLWPLRRWTPSLGLRAFRALVLEKIPLFALSLAAGLQTLSAHETALTTFPLSLRVANAVYSCGRYLAHTFVPYRLTLFYPYPGDGVPPLSPARVAVSLLAVLALGAGALVTRRRCPYLLFGFVWFFGLLAPLLGVFQSGLGAMADRFTYLPCLGLWVAIVWTFADLANERRMSPRLLATFTGALVMVAAALTFVEVGYYRDTATLFGRAIQATGANWMGESQLGTVAMTEGGYQTALEHFRTAYDLAPHAQRSIEHVGEAYEALGRNEEAVAFYLGVLKDNPHDAQLYNLTALSLVHARRYNDAANAFRRAIELAPTNAVPYVNLAGLYRATGRADLAEPVERAMAEHAH